MALDPWGSAFDAMALPRRRQPADALLMDMVGQRQELRTPSQPQPQQPMAQPMPMPQASFFQPVAAPMGINPYALAMRDFLMRMGRY